MNILSEIEELRVEYARATAEKEVLSGRTDVQRAILENIEECIEGVIKRCDLEGILNDVRDRSISVSDAYTLLDESRVRKAVHCAVCPTASPKAISSTGEFELFNREETWVCKYGCTKVPAFRVISRHFEVTWEYDAPVYPKRMHVGVCSTEDSAHCSGTLLVFGHDDGHRVLLAKHVLNQQSSADVLVGGGCYAKYCVQGNGWEHSGWMAQLQFETL